MNEQGLLHNDHAQGNFSVPLEVLGYNTQLSAVKMDGFEVPYLL
jgi:hypothetical protein